MKEVGEGEITREKGRRERGRRQRSKERREAKE